MKFSKISFGLRMWAIKQAKVQLQKKQEKLAQEQRTLEEQFKPIAPLDQPITASITLKPIEVTAPVPAPGQRIEIQAHTALDLAVEKLRKQVNRRNRCREP
jgi:hypothetical protein